MDIYIKVAQVSFPVVSVLVVIFGWRAQRKSDKLKIVQGQLSQFKTEAYSGVYTFFFDILRDVKKKQVNDSKSLDRLMKIKETVLSYGSDKVIQSLSLWLQSTNQDIEPYKKMMLLGDLLIEIRKDMGYSDTQLTSEDILLYIMQQEEELEKFKERSY